MSIVKNNVHLVRLVSILVTIFAVFMILLALYYVSQSSSINSVAPSESIEHTSKSTFKNMVRDYLSTVDPDVRYIAIDILRSYINKSYVVLQTSEYISAGSSRRVEFNYYYPFIYELTISVSGNCIGTCDIGVNLMDQNFKVIKYMGRVSYFRENLTVLLTYSTPLEKHQKYYLELDNSYSIFTPKTIYVTIKGYLLEDRVLNDKSFKLIALGLWVSINIKYISDPYEMEYVASPRETLRSKAGDCDDFAVLLASMYRAVGLRSGVGVIDTNGDKIPDHTAALVALERSEFEEFKNSLTKYSIVFGEEIVSYCVSYFKRDNYLWITIDPPMARSRKEPWCVNYSTYYLIELIEPR